MPIGDGSAPNDADVSQLTASGLLERSDTIIKTYQVSAQALLVDLVNKDVTTFQVTAQPLIQQTNTEFTMYQVTAQILVSVTQISDPTAPYDIRRSTVN